MAALRPEWLAPERKAELEAGTCSVGHFSRAWRVTRSVLLLGAPLLSLADSPLPQLFLVPCESPHTLHPHPCGPHVASPRLLPPGLRSWLSSTGSLVPSRPGKLGALTPAPPSLTMPGLIFTLCQSEGQGLAARKSLPRVLAQKHSSPPWTWGFPLKPMLTSTPATSWGSGCKWGAITHLSPLPLFLPWSTKRKWLDLHFLFPSGRVSCAQYAPHSLGPKAFSCSGYLLYVPKGTLTRSTGLGYYRT